MSQDDHLIDLIGQDDYLLNPSRMELEQQKLARIRDDKLASAERKKGAAALLSLPVFFVGLAVFGTDGRALMLAGLATVIVWVALLWVAKTTQKRAIETHYKESLRRLQQRRDAAEERRYAALKRQAARRAKPRGAKRAEDGPSASPPTR